jgi:L-serine dehydratase
MKNMPCCEALAHKHSLELKGKHFSLGELIRLAESEKVPFSTIVIAEAMAKEDKSRQEVLADALSQFSHNLRALEIGITSGKSFLLGSVGSDLVNGEALPILNDRFLNRAVVYTLGTEVGNHEIGLRPCAGTGDSCPYTGLLRALREENIGEDKLAVMAALILKIGSYFRAGKQTTGCNMEGYGAGSAVTAAVLTELSGGSPSQVAKAIVLALSPTIAVPCTPRVMVSGLCATHIGAAILVGNLAARLVLHSAIPVDVDVDVMLAMAARVHVEAAPVITRINLDYMQPYFKKNSVVESFVDQKVRNREAAAVRKVEEKARQEVRGFAAASRPLTRCLGDVVVGGSSLAVGSPSNMSRICHALISGKISRIDIELTTDLFVRRAINTPSMLMAAILGAKTDDITTYKSILNSPELKNIVVCITEVKEPEVQRIRITASERSAFLDARNRGGGRVRIIQAEPSIQEAEAEAVKLGIHIADS